MFSSGVILSAWSKDGAKQFRYRRLREILTLPSGCAPECS